MNDYLRRIGGSLARGLARCSDNAMLLYLDCQSGKLERGRMAEEDSEFVKGVWTRVELGISGNKTNLPDYVGILSLVLKRGDLVYPVPAFRYDIRSRSYLFTGWDG